MGYTGSFGDEGLPIKYGRQLIAQAKGSKERIDGRNYTVTSLI
jgi:hypothetical protein